MTDIRLIIDPEVQEAKLYKCDDLCKTYIISTSRSGLGCEENSNKTPTGLFKIAAKFGDEEPLGRVFRSREPKDEIWTDDPANPLNEGKRDLILTRILWLSGQEEHNKNTLKRYIYMHGTRREAGLGTPQSAGCIGFKNVDILDVFDEMSVGDDVEILNKPYKPA